MASDQEIGKKELEFIQLGYFCDAYQHATGITLSPITGIENPDFVVEAEDGRIVGVELTKLMRPPEEQFVARVIDRQEEPDPYGQLDKIHYLIAKKEEARSNRYIEKVADTILVIELVDGTLSNIIYLLDGLKGEYRDHGFVEVWLADYSGTDAYGNVELFCLYPEHNWGFVERPNAGSKPYG